VIDLHTANTSNGQRAAIILEECGLPHRVRAYDLFKGEHKNPEFLAIAPAGAIPVIVDPEGPGGKPITIAQSCAIILYAAEKSGKFIPADPARRATALQWLVQAAADVSASSGNVFFNSMLLPDKSEQNGKWYLDRVFRHFTDCDRQLGSGEFLAGEISVADFALYPVFAVRRKTLEEVGSLPNLARWGDQMASREGVRKGLAAVA